MRVSLEGFGGVWKGLKKSEGVGGVGRCSVEVSFKAC